MASYDSGSSDNGDDYTETNVLLGYATKDATGDPISHLGGVPKWIDNKTAPSGALAKCKVCNDYLSLLLELNGDLPEHFPGHERRLYVWSCKRKTCRRKEGSVRGVRGLRVSKDVSTKEKVKEEKQEAVQVKPISKLGESLFGVKTTGNLMAPTNPFSKAGSSQMNTDPFTTKPEPTAVPPKSEEKSNDVIPTLPETFASKLSLGLSPAIEQTPRPHELWPSETAFPTAFPHFWLDAEYETLDNSSALIIPANARMDIGSECSATERGKEDKEVFESSMDTTFQKFADRIGENAEQVLRYEFKGRPLLYSDKDNIGKLLIRHADNHAGQSIKVTTAGSSTGLALPRCQICGADRVFELQLAPQAITELEADDMGLDGMEWGTIIMAVCSKDCKPTNVSENEVGYVEEWIGVQWEEVTSRK